MQEEVLTVLITQRDRVLAQLDRLMAQQRELEEELVHWNALITKHDNGGAVKGELKMMPPPKPRPKTTKTRVRGVLAAARKAVEEFSGPFDKNQLIAKLIELDGDFAHKKITGSNIRNTLRLLTLNGVIKVESAATARSCAKYVRAA